MHYVQARSSRHLPPAVEEALKKYTGAVRDAAHESHEGWEKEQLNLVEAKESHWLRKLRRAIAADLHPEAVTQVYKFKKGDLAVWLKAEGNGGSYRSSPRRHIRCTVLADTGKGKIQVEVDEGESFLAGSRWVLRRCVLPRAVWLSQGM